MQLSDNLGSEQFILKIKGCTSNIEVKTILKSLVWPNQNKNPWLIFITWGYRMLLWYGHNAGIKTMKVYCQWHDNLTTQVIQLDTLRSLNDTSTTVMPCQDLNCSKWASWELIKSKQYPKYLKLISFPQNHEEAIYNHCRETQD